MNDLTKLMTSWREGYLSDGEMLAWLFEAQAEVLASLRREEEKVAQKRIEKLFSVECPHCHWGFHSSVIEQHIRDKH